MEAVIHDGGIDRFDDLHVDQIDKTWKLKGSWISAALEAFATALDVRDASSDGRHLKIVLAFSLKADVRPLGTTFKDRASLEKDLSWTPPSLYVFRPGEESWNRLKVSNRAEDGPFADLQFLNATKLLGAIARPTMCVYQESKRPEDDEYYRCIMLAEE